MSVSNLKYFCSLDCVPSWQTDFETLAGIKKVVKLFFLGGKPYLDILHTPTLLFHVAFYYILMCELKH